MSEIAANVNAQATTWIAQTPANFQDTEDVKAYLGAYLPGDALYEEDPVKTIRSAVQAPAEFDCLTNWPKCTVIGNTRDQSSCGSCPKIHEH